MLGKERYTKWKIWGFDGDANQLWISFVFFILLFVTKDMHPAHGGDSKRLNISYAFSSLTASKVQRSGATYALWSHQKLAAAAGHATRVGCWYSSKDLEFFFLAKIRFFCIRFLLTAMIFLDFCFFFNNVELHRKQSNSPEVRKSGFLNWQHRCWLFDLIGVPADVIEILTKGGDAKDWYMASDRTSLGKFLVCSR